MGRSTPAAPSGRLRKASVGRGSAPRVACRRSKVGLQQAALGMDRCFGPRTIDTDGPAQGIQRLDLQELWRGGGQDENVLFGRITDLKRHPDGTFYVLDTQLCQVVVISHTGELLRDLSRQGDGGKSVSAN